MGKEFKFDQYFYQVMAYQRYFSGFDSLSSDIDAQLMDEAKPSYLHASERAGAVVICVHGFTGNPYEVTPAARAIADAGCDAVAPLLPGHGYRDRKQQEQQFAAISKQGMLAAARAEITRARTLYSKVGMFGFSMGGSIALAMAAESLLDVCAVAAPALRLPRKAELLIPLLGWADFTMEAPPQEPFYLPVYEFHHARALRTLWRLGRHARGELSHIQCPILGVHSHNDLTVPPVVLALMEQHIPGAVETAWFDESGHSMLLDVQGEAVALKVAEFFHRHLGE